MIISQKVHKTALAKIKKCDRITNEEKTGDPRKEGQI